MIAIDTNILVHAHRRDSPWHAPAERRVRELAEGNVAWAIPWPCLCEFASVVTHPRIFGIPSTMTQACAQIDAWVGSPSLVLLHEGPGSWAHLRTLLLASQVAGPRVHDGRIAALCLQHRVRELWSADRDFTRFPQLKVVNPLMAA